MSNLPLTITAGLLLLRINAFLWLGFGVLTAVGAHPALPETPLIRWGMSVLALACAFALLILEYFLRRHSRKAYTAVLALLVIIALLLFADQFGLADLAVLILTLAPAILLIKDRAWYLRSPVAGEREPRATEN